MADLTSNSTAGLADELFASTSSVRRGFRMSKDHRPLSSRTKFLSFALIFYLVMEVVSLLHDGVIVWFLNAVSFGDVSGDLAQTGQLIDTVALPITVFFLLSLVWCWISYCMFVYRAVANLQRADAQGVTTSPGMAVAWSFIPYANLVMPFRVMGQIISASRDPLRASSGGGGIQALWWLCYLGGNILSTVSVFVSRAGDLDSMKTAIGMDIIASIAGIVAAVCLLKIINRITRDQEDWKQLTVFD